MNKKFSFWHQKIIFKISTHAVFEYNKFVTKIFTESEVKMQCFQIGATNLPENNAQTKKWKENVYKMSTEKNGLRIF